MFHNNFNGYNKSYHHKHDRRSQNSPPIDFTVNDIVFEKRGYSKDTVDWSTNDIYFGRSKSTNTPSNQPGSGSIPPKFAHNYSRSVKNRSPYSPYTHHSRYKEQSVCYNTPVDTFINASSVYSPQQVSSECRFYRQDGASYSSSPTYYQHDTRHVRSKEDLHTATTLVNVARNLEQLLYSPDKLERFSGGASSPTLRSTSIYTDLEDVSGQLSNIFGESQTNGSSADESEDLFKELELDVELNLLVENIIAE